MGVQYLEAWLRGLGCVPLYDLMEDAATAEISRTQIWQWIRHGAMLDDGRVVTTALVRRLLDEEMAAFGGGRFAEARRIFEELSTSAELAEFLTLPAYETLLAEEASPEQEKRP